MIERRQSLMGVFMASALLTAACGSSPERTAGPPPPPSAQDERQSLTDQEIERIYRERIEDTRSRFTEADVRFMTDMIHHHAQAIEISRFADTHGASNSVRTLAARIINAQRDEIALMRRWLEDRNQPAPDVHLDGESVMVHSGGDEPAHDMPGMLSPAQVEALDRARGTEFDRLFLTSMIEHHEGAVTMVRRLFSTDGAGQDEDVFRFASDVQVDQATEVARMRTMLEAFPPEDEGG